MKKYILALKKRNLQYPIFNRKAFFFILGFLTFLLFDIILWAILTMNSTTSPESIFEYSRALYLLNEGKTYLILSLVEIIGGGILIDLVIKEHENT